MEFFSKDNILILAADEGKKSKKGDGINAILALCQEIRTFSEKIEAAAEAQDIVENRQIVEALRADLDKHLEALIDVAKGSIKSIRHNPMDAKQPSQGSPAADVTAPSLPSTPSPIG